MGLVGNICQRWGVRKGLKFGKELKVSKTFGSRHEGSFNTSSTQQLQFGSMLLKNSLIWRTQPHLNLDQNIGTTISNLSRRCTTKTTSSHKASQVLPNKVKPSTTQESQPKLTIERCPPIVGYWLLGMGALVFGIVIVGGLTRLTESGLSIVEWNLIKGVKPPTTEAEWELEFQKYQQFPEFKKLNSRMTLEEFKFIFFMEWLHRLWGRAIGLAFILPAGYFYARGKLTPTVAKRCLGLAGLIGLQGGLGWYMVKSGLDQKLLEDPSAVPRVSQYRLASHLGAAFILYSGFMLQGFEILADNKHKVTPLKGFLEKIQDPKLKAFRRFAIGTTALVFITAMSGAFVAGLDAGLVYNSFPYMGEGIVPPTEEMWSPLYATDRGLVNSEPSEGNPPGMWRNIFDNPTTVQLNHRVLAMTTLTSIVALYALSRRLRLPRNAKVGVTAMAGVSAIQVSLGISTLIYLVPVSLAAAHQAGSLVLLTSGLFLTHSLRRLPPTLLKHSTPSIKRL